MEAAVGMGSTSQDEDEMDFGLGFGESPKEGESPPLGSSPGLPTTPEQHSRSSRGYTGAPRPGSFKETEMASSLPVELEGTVDPSPKKQSAPRSLYDFEVLHVVGREAIARAVQSDVKAKIQAGRLSVDAKRLPTLRDEDWWREATPTTPISPLRPLRLLRGPPRTVRERTVASATAANSPRAHSCIGVMVKAVGGKNKLKPVQTRKGKSRGGGPRDRGGSGKLSCSCA